MKIFDDYRQRLDQGLSSNDSNHMQICNELSKNLSDSAREQSALLTLKIDHCCQRVLRAIDCFQASGLENDGTFTDGISKTTGSPDTQLKDWQTHSTPIPHFTTRIPHRTDLVPRECGLAKPHTLHSLRQRLPTDDHPDAIVVLKDLSDTGMHSLLTLLRIARSLLR